MHACRPGAQHVTRKLSVTGGIRGLSSTAVGWAINNSPHCCPFSTLPARFPEDTHCRSSFFISVIALSLPTP